MTKQMATHKIIRIMVTAVWFTISWTLCCCPSSVTAYTAPFSPQRSGLFHESTHCAEQRDAAQGRHMNLCRRRELLFVGFVLGGWNLSSRSSYAFENRISTKWDDTPKTRGPKPADLGVSNRSFISVEGERDEYVGLKGCTPSPNCFSSSIPVQDDPEHSIPPFLWPEGQSKEEALTTLLEVLKAYPPGQSGVDGGGFEIKAFDGNKGYIYVQYEALKRGYIDDVEFAVLGREREVQLRTSSRIGYLDFGVNAKRINYIAKELRAKGWKAEGVDFAKHLFYAEENRL